MSLATTTTYTREAPPANAGHARVLVTQTTTTYWSIGPNKPHNGYFRGAGGPGVPAHVTTKTVKYWE